MHRIFKRFEMKYVIPWKVACEIRTSISRFCERDPYAGPDGSYIVSSMYYDSNSLKSYYEKVDGEKFRRKVRVRIYGESYDNSFLEIKQKMVNNVKKKRVKVPLDFAYDFLESPFIDEEMEQDYDAVDIKILSEAGFLATLYRMKPKVIITYSREAYRGIYEPDFRLTFDKNLKCRKHDLRLEHGHHGKYFIPPNYTVMEVKFNNLIPKWMVNIIGRHQCLLQKVSKFCAGIDRSKPQGCNEDV